MTPVMKPVHVPVDTMMNIAVRMLSPRIASASFFVWRFVRLRGRCGRVLALRATLPDRWRDVAAAVERTVSTRFAAAGTAAGRAGSWPTASWRRENRRMTRKLSTRCGSTCQVSGSSAASLSSSSWVGEKVAG